MGHPGLGGEVAFPAGGHFQPQQLGQHLGIGQVLVGGGVQGVVQSLNRLLESQGLQVLTCLFQGDHRHRTPPATKPKPRWDVHLSGDDDQMGGAGESLSSVLGK